MNEALNKIIKKNCIPCIQLRTSLQFRKEIQSWLFQMYSEFFTIAPFPVLHTTKSRDYPCCATLQITQIGQTLGEIVLFLRKHTHYAVSLETD